MLRYRNMTPDYLRQLLDSIISQTFSVLWSIVIIVLKSFLPLLWDSVWSRILGVLIYAVIQGITYFIIKEIFKINVYGRGAYLIHLFVFGLTGLLLNLI